MSNHTLLDEAHAVMARIDDLIGCPARSPHPGDPSPQGVVDLGLQQLAEAGIPLTVPAPEPRAIDGATAIREAGIPTKPTRSFDELNETEALAAIEDVAEDRAVELRDLTGIPWSGDIEILREDMNVWRATFGVAESPTSALQAMREAGVPTKDPDHETDVPQPDLDSDDRGDYDDLGDDDDSALESASSLSSGKKTKREPGTVRRGSNGTDSQDGGGADSVGGPLHEVGRISFEQAYAGAGLTSITPT